MVWSYSKVSCYEMCPKRWFLTYIMKKPDSDMFYASYGSFMHKLLEKFYNGDITQSEMLFEFLSGFKTNVKGKRPKESTIKNYINSGVNYIKWFTPLPYKILGLEKRVRFKIEDREFVGVLDFIGEDESDGEIIICDNKSRKLKPRSSRKTPTQNDMELDKMLRQLYLYSIAVHDIYGKYPKELIFNCFNNNTIIKEPFKEEALCDAKKWALDSISVIREDSDFFADPEFYKCEWICGVCDSCDDCYQG